MKLEVDNAALSFAWEKIQMKQDKETSILLRTLHVVAQYLECQIFVVHLKRKSMKWSAMVNRQSREATTTADDRQLVERLGWGRTGGKLAE